MLALCPALLMLNNWQGLPVSCRSYRRASSVISILAYTVGRVLSLKFIIACMNVLQAAKNRLCSSFLLQG